MEELTKKQELLEEIGQKIIENRRNEVRYKLVLEFELVGSLFTIMLILIIMSVIEGYTSLIYFGCFSICILFVVFLFLCKKVEKKQSELQ
jgi:hypothetical protein